LKGTADKNGSAHPTLWIDTPPVLGRAKARVKIGAGNH
jgi:hypothetical protein